MWDALFINTTLVINQSHDHRIIDASTNQILLDDDYAVYAVISSPFLSISFSSYYYWIILVKELI